MKDLHIDLAIFPYLKKKKKKKKKIPCSKTMQTPHLPCCPFLGFTLPSFKRRKQIQKQNRRKHSIPHCFGRYIHLCWRNKWHRANKDNYSRRIHNYCKVQLHHYYFSIPRIGLPDFCSCLNDKGTTYAIFRIWYWLNFSQCNQISYTKGMPGKTQTKAFNL